MRKSPIFIICIKKNEIDSLRLSHTTFVVAVPSSLQEATKKSIICYFVSNPRVMSFNIVTITMIIFAAVRPIEKKKKMAEKKEEKPKRQKSLSTHFPRRAMQMLLQQTTVSHRCCYLEREGGSTYNFPYGSF